MRGNGECECGKNKAWDWTDEAGHSYISLSHEIDLNKYVNEAQAVYRACQMA